MKRVYLPKHLPYGISSTDYWDTVPRGEQPGPQLHDKVEAEKVLLVDKAGQPLIVERPRPVGFRP